MGEDEDDDPAAAKALEEAKAKAMAKLAKKEANQRSYLCIELNCRVASRAFSHTWLATPAPISLVDLRDRSLCNLEIKPWEADPGFTRASRREDCWATSLKRRVVERRPYIFTPSRRTTHTQRAAGSSGPRALKLVDVAFGVQKLISAA